MTANEYKEDEIKRLKEKQNKLQYELNECEKYADEHADEIKKLNDLQTDLQTKTRISDTISKEIQNLRDQIYTINKDIEKWKNKSPKEIMDDPGFIDDNSKRIIEMSEKEKEENKKQKQQLIDENKPNDWHSGNI